MKQNHTLYGNDTHRYNAYNGEIYQEFAIAVSQNLDQNWPPKHNLRSRGKNKNCSPLRGQKGTECRGEAD